MPPSQFSELAVYQFKPPCQALMLQFFLKKKITFHPLNFTAQIALIAVTIIDKSPYF